MPTISVRLDNDFRHPAILAKEAATLDVLSEGRLELGIGAGWLPQDYQHTGIPFLSARERFGRLRETIAICKQCFAPNVDMVTYDGTYYQVRDLPAFPKPVQMHLPFIVGGRQCQMLAFAAREADVVSVQTTRARPNDPPPPPISEKIGWIREAAGDRLDEIELHMMSNVILTDDGRAELGRIADRLGVTADEVERTPAYLVGSPAAIVDQLCYWRETCGFSYYTVGPDDLERLALIMEKAIALDSR